MAKVLLLVRLLAALAAPEGRVVDRVAATVNGEVVTLSELEERAGPDYLRAEQMKPGEAREKARARVLRAALDQLVAERLFEGQAAALQIEVSDAQVDAAMEDIKRNNRFSDAQLEQALE